MSPIDKLEIGLMLTSTTNGESSGEVAYPSAIREMAIAAEQSGFDVLLAGDHIAYPEKMDSDYPFSPTGELPFDYRTPVFDVFQTLSFIAAVTEEIKLGTNVCIPPLRHPVLLTKNILTLDSVSSGRAELGVGAGWLKSEYEVMGIPFEERGKRLDEFLQILTKAQREKEISFDGDFFQFQNTGFYPTARGDLPLWVGGNSGATCRRAAEFGAGWTGVWSKPEDVEQMRSRLSKARDDYNTEGELEMAVLRPARIYDSDHDGGKILQGSPARIQSDLRKYAEAGATRVIIYFEATDFGEGVSQIRKFGERIILD